MKSGGVVAFPTETVYGLGADAFNASAVARIFEAKGRPRHDPLIVHVLGIDDLPAVAAEVPALAPVLAAAFWPGPLTLIVPRSERLPDSVTAGLDTVAVRAPSHRVARALLAASALPIAAPSANLFGRTSATSAEHVIADLGDKIDVVLDSGPTPVGIESTVLDLCSDTPEILRPGAVRLEDLASLAPGVRVRERADPQGPQPAPGMLPRHYAPQAKLLVYTGSHTDVVEAIHLTATRLAGVRKVGLLLFAEDRPLYRELADHGSEAAEPSGLSSAVSVEQLGSRADLDAIAHNLYRAMRSLDSSDVEVILAPGVAEEGIGLALMDRLRRAAEAEPLRVSRGQAQQAATRALELLGASSNQA